MRNEELKVYPVLLAGGTGTRLWPVSRMLYPKQLIKFIGEDSLIQATAKRLSPALDLDNVRVVCGNDHYHEIARHLEEIGIAPAGRVLREPCGRNTAPAILLAVLHVLEKEQDAVVCVFPADHVIGDVEEFHRKLASAIRLAESGLIVTFGIKPHYPETGYGYIEGEGDLEEDALKVKKFREKPDRNTAEKYLEAGNFFWNSGMFVFKASVMKEEFRVLAPEIWEGMGDMVARGEGVLLEDYSRLPNTSIDYAIMEKTDKAALLPSDFGWSDIGSWKSLYDFLPKDENGNVIDGDVMAENTSGCFIMGRERLVAANCIENLVIVDTPDSVFVSDLDRSKDAKVFVEKLKKSNRREHRDNNEQFYPWGSRATLEARAGREVSRVSVRSGARAAFSAAADSIQHVVVVEGEGLLLSNGQRNRLAPGDYFDLDREKETVLENSGAAALVFFHVRLLRGLK